MLYKRDIYTLILEEKKTPYLKGGNTLTNPLPLCSLAEDLQQISPPNLKVFRRAWR